MGCSFLLDPEITNLYRLSFPCSQQNPTIFNIIRWLPRWMGQTTHKEIMKKINTWNIRRLVNESFGPSAWQTSI